MPVVIKSYPMTKILQPDEREQLLIRHHKERDKRTCDRIKAVLAYDDGYSYAEIARILLLNETTIKRHIDGYLHHQKLNTENGGSASKLSEKDSQQLIAHLNENTYLYVKDICAYIEKTYQKIYSISGMCKWLHNNAFCYKKPHGVPAKADAEKQEAFIKAYTALKATLGADEPIYFGDSVHPQHQTQAVCGWIKKGLRKEVKKTACQKRVNIIGAINIATKQLVYQEADWVNVDSLKAFAVQLCADNPTAKKIHWILDNAGYHKSKEFSEFIETTNIKIHYLPPYSPNLNPIERLWKVMREKVTYNTYYEKFSDFKKIVLDFFENIDRYRSTIESRITDNFQRLGTV
jgi:transposase